ncbi:MAG: YicC family protein [Acidobacteriota bacterium]|nr:YicC family protein [Acidobacteriota bacterium]
MIMSMTGFAERSFDAPTMRLKIAIKSLNHRFLDWSYKGAAIGDVENRLRVLCQDHLHRGRIEVVLDMHHPDPSSWDVTVNEGLMEKILGAIDRASSRLGHDLQVTAESLLRIPQIMELRRKEFTPDEVAFLERSFLRTLEDVLKARRVEGRKTAVQLQTHIQSITKAVGRLEKNIRRHPKLVRQRLRQKVREGTNRASASEERLDEEVAYLAQRYDVSEEIHRLKCHLETALQLIRSPKGEPAGKMLDFLAQELYREANTLNSKSQDIDVTREGLIIKGEVESIRQQVQNLE